MNEGIEALKKLIYIQIMILSKTIASSPKLPIRDSSYCDSILPDSTPSQFVKIIFKEVCWWGHMTIIPKRYEILP